MLQNPFCHQTNMTQVNVSNQSQCALLKVVGFRAGDLSLTISGCNVSIVKNLIHIANLNRLQPVTNDSQSIMSSVSLVNNV